jgi:2-isopropylmalate synthase
VTDYVRIFDTTLRDGEQSPGATMTSQEKLDVALALARLGVDVIEAGFPAASPDDLAAVRTIAERVGAAIVAGRKNPTSPIICALARAAKLDIDRAAEAVAPAPRRRIHSFLATSDIHLEHKLRMTREQVLDRVGTMVAYAHEKCPDVEFSPEDAGRSDPEFLYRVLEVAIAAGATTLNIPDTVGYTTPEEFGALISGIKRNVRGIERAVISVHCHDDLGMAVANTLAGIRAGARQAEVTINGIGERAGNASLEEVVMALHTRRALFGLHTGIETTHLVPISRMVSNVTGIVVPPNKAIVGANAFAHESGIHQDGMLKHQTTYEIMRPETVGASQTNLVLGKHSGRAALRARLETLGVPVTDAELDVVFTAFKALADKKKTIADADLLAIAQSSVREANEQYVLDGLQVTCGTMGMPTATVRLRDAKGEMHVHAAVGTGPVHAAFKAIEDIVGKHATLQEFFVHGVTAGIDALGEVSVRIRNDGDVAADAADEAARIAAGGAGDEDKQHPQHEAVQPHVFHGYGADTDIVVASAKAYLAAINRFLQFDDRVRSSQPGLIVGTRGEA